MMRSQIDFPDLKIEIVTFIQKRVDYPIIGAYLKVHDYCAKLRITRNGSETRLRFKFAEVRSERARKNIDLNFIILLPCHSKGRPSRTAATS